MRRRGPIVFRTMDPHWLSNSWLCADREGGHAVLIDSGGPLEPIVARIEAWRVTLTHVLCTHHHPDHVAHNTDYRQRFGCTVCAHATERAWIAGLDATLADGDEVPSGELRVRALHVPGHTVGQLAFVVDDSHVFTGDTLFAGSVGGTRGHGHGTYDELRASIVERLLRLPPTTVVCPGHMAETTVGRELDANPFVRFWLGREVPLDVRCTALGRPATLLVRAADYDGGTKCIVRFDDGAVDVVPGSRVAIDQVR